MQQQGPHLSRGHTIGRLVPGESLPACRDLRDGLGDLDGLSMQRRTMALLAELSLKARRGLAIIVMEHCSIVSAPTSECGRNPTRRPANKNDRDIVPVVFSLANLLRLSILF